MQTYCTQYVRSCGSGDLTAWGSKAEQLWQLGAHAHIEAQTAAGLHCRSYNKGQRDNFSYS